MDFRRSTNDTPPLTPGVAAVTSVPTRDRREAPAPPHSLRLT